MSITIQQTVFQPVPTGKYPARITAVEEAVGQFGAQVKILFELPPDENGEPRAITGWAAKKFSNKSKLFEWTLAALGPFDRSYVFNSDDLIGKKVMLVVTEREGEKGVMNVITSILPYPKPQPVQTPPLNW